MVAGARGGDIGDIARAQMGTDGDRARVTPRASAGHEPARGDHAGSPVSPGGRTDAVSPGGRTDTLSRGARMASSLAAGVPHPRPGPVRCASPAPGPLPTAPAQGSRPDWAAELRVLS